MQGIVAATTSAFHGKAGMTLDPVRICQTSCV